ncbi:MAG: antibiotic biosynthesis monooxygenase family protein [Bacteroidota bacterium]
MIIRIVKMEVKDSEIENFKSMIQSIQDKIESFDGCHSVNILCDKNQSNRFFSYSSWETEQHLNDYRKSEFFVEIWSEVKKFFIKEAQAWTVEDAFNGVIE